jgi:hypothetical protein
MYDTDAKPRYSDSTNLPGRVRDLNPRWNEESNDALLDVSASLRDLADAIY